MKPVVVLRSGWKMWWIAVGSIPLLVIGLDVLTERRITNWLRELLFRPNETQIYEPRDVIWAWAMTLFASILILMALKELFAPTRLLETTPEGLRLKLRGPFRHSDLIPWSQIGDVREVDIEDEEETLPLLGVEVFDRGDLPEHPWGARWVDPRILGILAQDWGLDPSVVSNEIAEYAVWLVGEKRKERTKAVWED